MVVDADLAQYSDFYNVQVPVYERVMALPLRVVVYSGTADTVVPYLGTQRWIWNMMNGTTPTTAWQSWSVPSDTTQTAGYTVGWGNFRFVTIRGAGHLGAWVRALPCVANCVCVSAADKSGARALSPALPALQPTVTSMKRCRNRAADSVGESA